MSAPVTWCRRHDAQGVPRLGRSPSTCWKGEFVKHLSAHDCEMASATLTILTGDCEADCQDQCAYPGEFVECDL